MFCPITYAHNGPFNEPDSFGIPGLIFYAKVTKFGTNVGLSMLININFGFYQNLQQKWQILSHFPTSHIENHWDYCVSNLTQFNFNKHITSHDSWVLS